MLGVDRDDLSGGGRRGHEGATDDERLLVGECHRATDRCVAPPLHDVAAEIDQGPDQQRYRQKQVLLAPAFALTLLALPVQAQDTPAEQETSLWDWGMSLFGDAVTQELEPALGDMKALIDQLGPAVAPAIEKMMALVDDMTNYELPEMLENGDIIIRRKPDAPVVTPPADQGIEL